MRYILLVIGLLFLIPACTPEPEIIIQEVEVIKEVEKIVEVPVVEIREVEKIVEKIEYVDSVEYVYVEVRPLQEEVTEEEKVEGPDNDGEPIYEPEPAGPQAVAEPAAKMCMHAELGLVECP